MKIRAATDADRDAIWKIFHETAVAGDTYALDPNLSRKEGLQYWCGKNMRTYVAEDGDTSWAPTYYGLTSLVAART